MLEPNYLLKIFINLFYSKNNHKIAIINTSEGEEANEKYNNHIGSSDIESYKVIDQIRSCKKRLFNNLNSSCWY